MAAEPAAARTRDTVETSSGGTTMDGTLRAVIAADRLALTEALEGKELLHRRLRVFYGYLTLVAVLGAIVGRVGMALVEIDREIMAVVMRVQHGHALMMCLVYTGLRFWARTPRMVQALDVIGLVTTATTAATALSLVPRVLSVDLSAVSFFILFFSLRAALVPSKPWVATTVAAVCIVPFTIGIANLYGNAQIVDRWGATAAAVRAMLGGVAGVYVVSRTIYGLRRVVEQAVQLGQYVIHEKIGESGMGAVYRASHAMLKRPTAIKLIPPDKAGETATARFEREVLAASRLTHPNTIVIYDFGRTRGGVFYYAMELLDGPDLSKLVEAEGPQSVARTLHILRQVTAALGEAHDAGMVHRDVKPANVMLCTRGGERDFVKVLDFGLVKELATEASTKITGAATIVGTPLYMAPEAITAADTVGPPADVYAVGCIAYFLLVGQPPFPGESFFEVCAAHVHAPVRPVSLYSDEVPEALDALIVRCLAKEPGKRPTMRALGEELARIG